MLYMEYNFRLKITRLRKLKKNKVLLQKKKRLLAIPTQYIVVLINGWLLFMEQGVVQLFCLKQVVEFKKHFTVLLLDLRSSRQF